MPQCPIAGDATGLKSGDGLLCEAKQAIGPWVRGDLVEWDTGHLL